MKNIFILYRVAFHIATWKAFWYSVDRLCSHYDKKKKKNSVWRLQKNWKFCNRIFLVSATFFASAWGTNIFRITRNVWKLQWNMFAKKRKTRRRTVVKGKGLRRLTRNGKPHVLISGLFFRSLNWYCNYLIPRFSLVTMTEPQLSSISSVLKVIFTLEVFVSIPKVGTVTF